VHDIVRSGGTILGAAGTPGFAGDLAIGDDPIVAAGVKAGPARRLVEAGRPGQDAGARPPRLVRTGR
jgi:hypothetical protein